MFNIYETLRSAEYFIDNDYLKRYCFLIESNTRTQLRGRQTHKHHIIPRSWYKLTNSEVNDNLNNLVNLSKRNHFLAHYYLCLCTEDPFKYANQLALICLESHNNTNMVDKELLHRLPLYNYIYEDYTNKRNSKYKLYENRERT